MENLEKENLELKKIIKTLKEDNTKKLQTISSLNTIAISMTQFKDVSSILKEILVNVQNVTNSDGGTIYLTDGKRLSFKHIINKSLEIEHYDCDETEDVWNFLDINESNKNLVSISCALNKEIIRIDDVYESSEYDFSGTKEFDTKIGYRSSAMLVVPMLLVDGTLVGVLQLINKLDEHNRTIAFSSDDEQLAHSLASQASSAIDKYRQEKLLMGQSKMAAMGEMIDAIAHQWKQPLNVINIVASKIDMFIDMDIDISSEMLKESSDAIIEQVNHLSDTLDEFRTFLRPDKDKELVNINTMIGSVIGLLKDDLNKYLIETNIIGDPDLMIEVVQNEFKHIFINIINNAKDAFNENNCDNRQLIFEIKESIDAIFISIQDNAGGIPSGVIDSIFNANVTTKEEGKGTGIGLYMSRQIVEKNNGDISVENVSSKYGDGAKFTIKLNKE